MTINIEKTSFCTSEIKYLGHILSSNGLQPDPNKIEAIRNFLTPQNVRQLRMFLGCYNYYRKFNQLYSDTILPLNALLKKNTSWRWTKAEQIAFDKTKDLFLQTVLLKFPDFSKPFYVQADSSGYAIGAELYQENSTHEHLPIAFISRSLRGSELNYTITEKELLAIIYALSKFQTIILGNLFIIRTDHKALEFLHKCRFYNERIARWVIFLNGFNYIIEHISGKENIVANTLSRFPADKNIIVENSQPLVALLTINAVKQIHTFQPDSDRTRTLKNALKNFAQAQKEDHILSRIREHLI